MILGGTFSWLVSWRPNRMTQLPCANLSTARKWYGHSMLSEEVFASFPRLPALPLFLRSSSYRAHTHTPASPRLSHLLGVPTWMGQMVQPQPHELHTVQSQSRNLEAPPGVLQASTFWLSPGRVGWKQRN